MKNNTSTIALNYSALRRYLFTVMLLAISMVLFLTHGLFAQGSLLLTPKRVVFEGNKVSESINLANLGKDTARYVISLVHLRMREDGGFDEISQSEAGEFSAEPYIRYFPRTVTLAPNEAQVIRMQFVKKAGQMAKGEYRAHLYVRALPNPTPLGEKETAQSTSIAVKLVPVFGISLPVIIRVGESNTATSITGLSLKTSSTDLSNLSLTLNRSGNMSVYGDISVKHIASNGKSTLVSIVKGLAVYTPNLLRYIQLPLDNLVGVNYHSGKLVAQFNSNADGKDKKTVEAELALY